MEQKRKKNLKAKLFSLQGGVCCYCGTKLRLRSGPLSPFHATIEHLRRKVDGGTDRRDNLAVACFPCNSGRGDTDWLTYKSMKMGEI